MPVAITESITQVDPAHKKWTRDECEALVQAGLIDPERYELIEGELIFKMPKRPPHNVALFLLGNWLRSVFGEAFIVQEPGIDVAPEDIPTSEPEPDAIVLALPAVEFRTSLARPADIRLAIEVSNTTLGFDLTKKAALYARALIPEYWVLDINGRRLIVHRDPSEGRYQSVIAYAEDEPVSPLANPKATIRARDLL
jgi:Uma2 family endonuclease